ncbi:putative aminopeptidase FrvX [Salirhabdus euzebyi]|uniref:Putative aminopeptidase FrvX n=1 Tax=Salirhabdus euzebyi TaxID=394506 RepID=A0A841Q2V2_9BACI|nr:M20/M25/M40 family metallo-hydrolase [Salirhabdus euzebyi]MBB6451598.1 putative aminopeptidase FrvX [Salirhabdus euzebyi]
MKNWNQLFVRHGWLIEDKGENTFDCSKETDVNLTFLMECLNKAKVDYRYIAPLKELTIFTEITEEEWLKILNFNHRGRGGHLWFRPGQDQPKVRELDTFICGIVRQLNRLGFYTTGSCDGHERRPAHLILTDKCQIETLVEILHTLGQKQVSWRENRNGSYHLRLPFKRKQLLYLAEQLSSVEEEWVEEGYDFIKEKLFQQQLEQLLSIPGESGNEEPIRKHVLEKLSPFVDFITVDQAGNILAEKTYKGGYGPTILLNAHLDTVYEIEKDREIIKEGNLWSSSKGILGADDRAGVAVLLHVAEFLHFTNSFRGKVKFIFTVEEECGLVGASKVHDYFLWGTDAAIVVDRRGTGDIVTSCGGYIPFCNVSYGEFFEKLAEEAELNGWATTIGGSSDTRIWAEHGIQSVNLSAGYNHEHTEREVLDVASCYETAKLVKAVLGKGNELKRVLRDIRRGKQVEEVTGTLL